MQILLSITIPTVELPWTACSSTCRSKKFNPFTVKKHVMQAFSVVFTEYTRIQIKFQSYKDLIYYFDVYFFYFRRKGKRNIFSLYNLNLLILKFFKNITGLGQNSSNRLVCVTKVSSCSAEPCQSRGNLREHNIFFIFDLKGTLL